MEHDNQCWNVTKMERSVADMNSALYVDRPRRVDVTMFSGPLILVIVGLLVSVLIASAEIIYYRQRGRVSTLRRHCDIPYDSKCSKCAKK